MSISETASQAAAADPTVGVAVALSQTKSALLAGLESGDRTLGSLIGAQSAQALQVNTLLAGLESNLGQNVDLHA